MGLLLRLLLLLPLRVLLLLLLLLLLLIPKKYREKIMKAAHESLISGHLGINNTRTKIQTQFHWPGLPDDVMRFCRSCDICQKTTDKGRVPKAPLGRMPTIDVPFQ